MARLAPPPCPPSHITLEDGDGAHRLRTRLLLLWVTALTVLITAWLCTLGPIPAVVAVVTAKHILVAALVMGMGVDERRPAGP